MCCYTKANNQHWEEGGKSNAAKKKYPRISTNYSVLASHKIAKRFYRIGETNADKQASSSHKVPCTSMDPTSGPDANNSVRVLQLDKLLL